MNVHYICTGIVLPHATLKQYFKSHLRWSLRYCTAIIYCVNSQPFSFTALPPTLFTRNHFLLFRNSLPFYFQPIKRHQKKNSNGSQAIVRIVVTWGVVVLFRITIPTFIVPIMIATRVTECFQPTLLYCCYAGMGAGNSVKAVPIRFIVSSGTNIGANTRNCAVISPEMSV